MLQKFNSKRAVVFRQWTRKSYAAFNSLKLVVKISVMSVAYTLVNPEIEVRAQVDSTQQGKNYELEEVEVSGQRAPVTNSQMSRIVTVITKNDIDRAPAQSINDLIRNVPQVDLRQRGANGIQADLSIQGGSCDQSLILLNGVNISDPQTGHYSLNLPLDLESADRVEVVKGSLSRVYGANAFSGTVNVVTGQNPENYAKGSISAGDFGLFRSSVSVNQHSGIFQNFISATQGRSNGYMNNTNYKFGNTYYHGQANINGQKIGIQLGYLTKDFGANAFYSPKYPNQYETNDTYFGALTGKLQTGGFTFVPSAYLRRNYDHYMLNRLNPAAYQNFHQTDVFGFGGNASYSSFLGKTSLGIDYRKEVIYSTGLGDSLSKPRRIPGESSKKFLLGDSRENISLFFEHNVYVGNFALSAGVLASKLSKPDTIGFYPGVDASYQVTKAIRVFVSANSSMRLPTFTDYYYKSPTNIGNPNLRPESAWTYEGGVKFETRGLSAYASYFRRKGNDIIDWVRDSTTAPWRTVNYTKLNTYGVEVYARLRPGEYVPVLGFIDAITASYSYTEASKTADLESYYALDYLRDKVTVSLDHRIYKGMGASWRFTWQKRNGTYSAWDASSSSWLAPSSYPAFALFDGKIYYQYKYAKAFVEASNIFDSNYFDLGNLPQPGRWFKAGIEMKINWL
jgi:iron complex outermembrane receptor protein